ncbi:MAG: OmpA family protein [Rickettsiales bacterium]
MKKMSLIALGALAALWAAPVSVGAQPDNRDVVKDERSNVKNTFGNCVRTKWMNNRDDCGAGVTIDKEMLTVYFAFDSAQLTPAATNKLNNLVNILKRANNVASVNIVGYADQIGNNNYNYRLSARRADAVKNYLSSRGYNNLNKTEVRAFGESAPVSDCRGVKGNELKACLWRDRRVEVELNMVKR